MASLKNEGYQNGCPTYPDYYTEERIVLPLKYSPVPSYAFTEHGALMAPGRATRGHRLNGDAGMRHSTSLCLIEPDERKAIHVLESGLGIQFKLVESV